jgi:excisionase family DNA binding protein
LAAQLTLLWRRQQRFAFRRWLVGEPARKTFPLKKTLALHKLPGSTSGEEMTNKLFQDQTAAEPVMLNVDKVATMLDCSTRHIYRLEEKGQMPSAVRLGACVRWPRATIEKWIAEGCQPTVAV